jgi:hypothetical protein
MYVLLFLVSGAGVPTKTRTHSGVTAAGHWPEPIAGFYRTVAEG